MSVAIPEFDGRIISVPFSFKEEVDDGDGLGTAGQRVPDARPTGWRGWPGSRWRWPDCAPGDPGRERRVALVLSAYPTKRSRLGNAVGLDTPAIGARVCCARMGRAGYTRRRPPRRPATS